MPALIQRGADIEALLRLAVRGGTPGKVEVLLDAGADISYQTETGTNILISAMYSQATSEGEPLLPLVELLLARDASVLGESNWGESAYR